MASASTLVKEENCSDSLLACRICLASDVKLFKIREWGLSQVFVDVMGTTLFACDGLPQHLCVFCRALLLRSCGLRARCRRAEQLLKDALHHQHSITTSYIRSINRKLHNLAHTFSQDYSSDVKVFKHEDIQKEKNLDIFLIENNIDSDIKDFHTNVTYNNDDDDDIDTHFDVKPKIVQTELEDEVPQNTPKVNIEESIDHTVKQDVSASQGNVIENNDRTIKKDVKSCKRKFPEINLTERSDKTVNMGVKRCKKLVKNKTEKKQTEKKGQAWRLKPFCKEQGFKEFEEKYNFKIVSVSEEDMVKEMEARKDSDNYKYSAFKCESCFKGFLSQNTYDNHMKLHDPARGNVCRLCQKRFFRPAGLRDHMRDNHQLKFVCLRCDETINSKYCAVMHAEFHAGKTFKCDHCGEKFLKLTTCNSHMRMSHPYEMAEGGTCALCGEAFLSAAGLKMHKARSHGPNLPTLRCRTCKLRFESPAAIDRHRLAQPGGKCRNNHSSCTQCGEVCASEQDLLTHRMGQHALQLFTCDMCGKTFESKESVATHIDRVHLLIKPVPERPRFRQRPASRKRPARSTDVARCDTVCEHCGKRASCQATLKIHMNIHTGERPYKCSLCPKTYVTPQGLKGHEPVHSGARKWSCEECDATFMRQSSLSLHRRAVHSGERAYQCDICSKTFTQSGSLYTHVKYVHMKVKPPPRKRNKKAAT